MSMVIGLSRRQKGDEEADMEGPRETPDAKSPQQELQVRRPQRGADGLHLNLPEVSAELLYTTFLWTGEKIEDLSNVDGIDQETQILLKKHGLGPKEGAREYLPSVSISLSKVTLKNGFSRWIPFLCGFLGHTSHTEVQLMRWINELKIAPSDIREVCMYSNYSPCVNCCTMLMDPHFPVSFDTMSIFYRQIHCSSGTPGMQEEEHQEVIENTKRKLGSFMQKGMECRPLDKKAAEHLRWEFLPCLTEVMEEGRKAMLLYNVFLWTGEVTSVMNETGGLTEFLAQYKLQPGSTDDYWPQVAVSLATVRTIHRCGNELSILRRSKAFYCGIFDCRGNLYHTELQLIKWMKDLDISPCDLEEIELYTNYSPCLQCHEDLAKLCDPESRIPVDKMSIFYRKIYKDYKTQCKLEKLQKKMKECKKLEKANAEEMRNSLLECLQNALKSRYEEDEMESTAEWLEGLEVDDAAADRSLRPNEQNR
ncbi:unnamed protein product [Darwinula stevensoni]|uniref:Activation-induced cytidine deaminase AID domain-containing protein n=1 Tax=Darwinula stevensoni TaxID=69355 RepID=A0A7R8X842_9CRUS|nr:unnamed protein product [Darwinula stevensoni]CAG0889710.1 unnamed protein product [Darwinula stevensoni]